MLTIMYNNYLPPNEMIYFSDDVHDTCSSFVSDPVRLYLIVQYNMSAFQGLFEAILLKSEKTHLAPLHEINIIQTESNLGSFMIILKGN